MGPAQSIANKAWEDELEFFLDLNNEDATMPFAQVLMLYSRAGKHMQTSRTSIGAVFMPTMDTILHMKKLPEIASMRDAEEFVQE